MKKEDVQDAIIWALMPEDLGYTQLLKKAEERLRDKEPKYDLHYSVFDEALLGLMNKSVYKTKQAGRHSIYRLAPQRNEKNLDKIEGHLKKVSAELKKIEDKNISEILDFTDSTIKNLSKSHQRLLIRKHFEKEDAEKIESIMDAIDKVIAQAFALTERKGEEKLPNLYTSVDYAIKREHMGTEYSCLLPEFS
ncbi:hypothetical protein [Candidatus Nitrosotalea bavarica]|uniref:hypothetical protein n=1 Tax=Candidatus Nitrosotalea bavarica TaxID=1903277 RepID=UPI000C71247F|nr:hypothetical protein [Candidatus Nitrosotalea bavarica]